MKKIFKFSKVSKKVTTVICVLMALIMLMLVGVLLPLEMQILNQQLAASEERLRTTSFEALDKEVLTLLDSAVFLSTLKIVSLPQNHTTEDYKNYLNMKNQILAVGYINDYISSICISSGEEQFSLDTKTQSDRDITYDSVMAQSPQKIFETENFEFLKIENGGKSEYYFHYAVKNLLNNSVLFKVDQRSFSEQIFEKQSDVMFQGWLDTAGDVAFSLSNENIGSSFSDIFPKGLSKDYASRERIEIGGETGYFTVTQDTEYSFRLVTVLKADSYQKNYQIFFVGIIILLLLLIAVFVITVVISNMSYKPFKEILALVEDSKGNIPLEEDNAEYNYIISNIQKIIYENKELNLQVDEAVEKFREQQFIACQMQISPHFLFNTLSSISGLSVITLSDMGNPITKAINNLANILSEVLLSQSKVVTIGKEIELTKTYIQILLLRYNNKFSVEWDVDEDLLEEYIIKLSLQPLIENAIQHAFDWKGEEAKIIISIKRENDKIYVSVKDNGIGLSKEQLAEIRSAMNDFSNIDKKIGLRNTNRRIKLLYGDQYEISIHGKKGDGTEFSFCYPIS